MGLLNKKGSKMKLAEHFTHIVGDPDCYDDAYTLKSNPNISIQDASSYGGGYLINEWLEDEQASQPHGTFTNLESAMTEALTLKDEEKMERYGNEA